MRDYLFDYFGSQPTDNRTERRIPGRPEVGALGSTGTIRGKPKTNLLDPDPTFYDDAGAYGGRTVADLRMGGSSLGGVGQPYRNTVPPAMVEQARGMAGLDAARLAPVTPGPPAHGTAGWMPPSERGGGPDVPPPMGRPATPGGTAPPVGPPGAGMTMPQAAPGGQVSGPAGVTPPPRPNFLGQAASGVGNLLGGAVRGVGNWMGTPVGNSRVTRGQMFFNTLGDIGEGLSTTGNLGVGLAHARHGQQELLKNDREQMSDDEEREYRRLEMDLKRQALAQKIAPQTHVIGAGGALVDPAGKELYRAKTAQKDATTAEAALLDPDTPPEIKAQAQELLRLKREPSERDMAYIASLERSGQHQKAMEEIARIRANRPAGDRTVGTSEYERLRERLPPDQREAMDRQRLKTLTTKGESAPFSAGELSGARKDYRSIQKARADIQRYAELYEKHGNRVLPSEAKGEMEAAYGAGLSALAAANNTGVIQPGELPMLQKQLLGPGGFGAEVGETFGVDTVGQVRGQAATMLDRLKKAEEELVGTYGADTLTGAKRDGSEETPPPAGDISRIGQMATDQERATLPIARSKEAAEAMPPGRPFILPSGRIGIR